MPATMPEPAEIARVAPDHDHAAPHPVADSVPGVAPYRYQPVTHSIHAGVLAGADIIAGIAFHVDPAPVHFTTQPVAAVAVDLYCAAFHAMTEVTAAVGLDADVAAGHLRANPGHQFRSAAQLYLLRVIAADGKQFSRPDRPGAIDQFETGRIMRGHQPVRRQRRQIQ